MPGPKTTTRLRVFAVRALLGILALYVLYGATCGIASRSTLNHLTDVLHDNLNEKHNNYDDIKVSSFGWVSDLYDWVSGLFGHFSLTGVALTLVLLYLAGKKFFSWFKGRRASQTAHSTSTP